MPDQHCHTRNVVGTSCQMERRCPPGVREGCNRKNTSPHIKSSVLHVIIYHYIMYIIISLYTYNIGLPVYDPCFEYFVPLLHRASFSNNKAIQSTCPSSAAMCKALTSKRSLAFTLAVKEKGEFLFYSLTTRLLSELIKAFYTTDDQWQRTVAYDHIC